MKNMPLLVAGLVAALFTACPSLPPAVPTVQNVEGTFLYSVEAKNDERAKQLMAQEMSKSSAALLLPTPFKVVSGVVVLGTDAQVSRYSVKKVDFTEFEGFEIGMYKGSLTANFIPWSGKVVRKTFPFSDIKTASTQTMVQKTILGTGLSAGTFKVLFIQFLEGDFAEIVMEVGP